MLHEIKRTFPLVAVVVSLILLGTRASSAQLPTRSQNFNSDPEWHEHNNRATSPGPAQITQNFGFTSTNYAGDPGDTTGEVGGTIISAGEAAYYAESIVPKTFNDRLTAAGTLYIGAAGLNTLLGFFHTDAVENGWRSPHQFVLRFEQPDSSSNNFRAFIDYSTSKWRANGALFSDASGSQILFSPGQYQFSMDYYPNGNNGYGSYEAVLANNTGTYRTLSIPGSAPFVATPVPMRVTTDGTQVIDAHKNDGATLNRFGLLNRVAHYDARHGHITVDDLTINDSAVNTFAQNPGWDYLRNNVTYTSNIVRPKFNFGYSPTQHAGGAESGEMGGLIWSGDSRFEYEGQRMAYYGDVIADQGTSLTLGDPLEASGKVSFKRGVTDSITQMGFFHSSDSIRQSDSQVMYSPENFLGIRIEGPTDEGFYFYPTYGTNSEGVGSAETTGRGDSPPRILPNGNTHSWTLTYDPLGGPTQNGRITVNLDGAIGWLDVTADHRDIGAHFDRFGIITTHRDGNSQEVYFDDLTYTVRNPEPASIGLIGVGVFLALRRIRRQGCRT